MTQFPQAVMRVIDAGDAAGLAINVITLSEYAKTAQSAADLLGCQVGQIANSLIFAGQDSAQLYLLLTSGRHRVDLTLAATQIGERLDRAKPERIKKELGFVIGGVAPLGALQKVPTYMDQALCDYDRIWAAAGVAQCVFETTPQALARATNAGFFRAT